MVEHHKVRYSRVTRYGVREFIPTAKMKRFGFQFLSLGPEGPDARAKAWALYEEWLAVRKRHPEEVREETGGQVYPPGSIGWAWNRYRRTDAWARKAQATREKDWEWAWRWIGPVFGDVDPRTVEIEHVEALRKIVLEQKGLHTAHRVIKIWRAHWRVMAAMQLCELDADPSKIIQNTAPKGRRATWAEIEIVTIAKRAWREGYRGLAALLAVAWDTQFAPVDCRKLTLVERVKDRRGMFFDTSRGKTGKAVIGTLTRRSERVLNAYIASLGFELHGDAAIFRNRSGRPYSADTLGDDFRDIRALVFPGDTRQLMDIRRSGAVESLAGEVKDPALLAAKMGNSIDQSKKLQETYLPRRVGVVRIVDEARKRGRKRLEQNE